MGPKSAIGLIREERGLTRGDRMAVGAVLLSLPMALFFAVYGYATETVSAQQGFVLYMFIGTAIMLSFTFVHAWAFSDQR